MQYKYYNIIILIKIIFIYKIKYRVIYRLIFKIYSDLIVFLVRANGYYANMLLPKILAHFLDSRKTTFKWAIKPKGTQ